MAQDKTKTRIAFLNQEMDELHAANSAYWKVGQRNSHAARAQYQFRQERLEAIRKELAQLLNSGRQFEFR